MLEPCTCRHDRNFILARLKQMRTGKRFEKRGIRSEALEFDLQCAGIGNLGEAALPRAVISATLAQSPRAFLMARLRLADIQARKP